LDHEGAEPNEGAKREEPSTVDNHQRRLALAGEHRKTNDWDHLLSGTYHHQPLGFQIIGTPIKTAIHTHLLESAGSYQR
jgi:hypothetical protein